jgi:DUF4097 and DUF4098 domain-containing protein YvlB
MRRHRICTAFALSVLVAGCDLSVNRDIDVPAGARSGGAATINGRIAVGAGAVVEGDLRSVNGRIEIGSDARVRDLNTVNGSLRLADGATATSVIGVNARLDLGERVEVAGDVATVNGAINVGGSSVLHRHVIAVNGDILLRGVRVAGAVRNQLGDLRLLDGTQVEGDVVLEMPDHSGEAWTSTVVIGVGVQVRGTLRAERPIKLYIHPTAKVASVEGATPQSYQGTDVDSG